VEESRNRTSLLRAEAGFEAARRLGVDLHGHSFRACLEVPASEKSWVDDTHVEEALARCVAPLDYRYLNDRVRCPDDCGLARWIQDRLRTEHGLASRQLRLRSAPDQGVVLDDAGNTCAWQAGTIEAAHALPRVPATHPCHRMHGHSFRVTLYTALGSSGDRPSLQRTWKALSKRLDHRCLNDISGLENPTSEHLASWIWRAVCPELPALAGVSVRETATSGCLYRPEQHWIWKDLRFEAALTERGASPGDPRRRLHGHSYRARVQLSAPLDPERGWTVDFGVVKAHAKSALVRLDHHRLDLDPVRPYAGSVSVAGWLADVLEAKLPRLERVALTLGAGRGAVAVIDDRVRAPFL